MKYIIMLMLILIPISASAGTYKKLNNKEIQYVETKTDVSTYHIDSLKQQAIDLQNELDKTNALITEAENLGIE